MSLSTIIVRIAMLAFVLAVSGWLIAGAGIRIAALTGLSENIVGAAFTAVATSLPELVTTITAVRRGALTLAVAGIVGGNTFDVLFLIFSDVAYREGSIYHAVGKAEYFIVAWTMLLTAVLLMGLLKRDKEGPAGIGFESISILLIYVLGLLVQFAS